MQELIKYGESPDAAVSLQLANLKIEDLPLNGIILGNLMRIFGF